jgi:signal transduction histidine kinase
MGESDHILVVDDQADNIIIMERMLQRAGYRVSSADSGAAALEFLTHSIPDLILLDIMMPQMDGYATLHAIRQNQSLPFIPIMFVSAKQTIADTVTGLDSGADDYLVKPVNRDELLARMRVLLRLKQTRRELQREQENLRLLYSVSQTLHRSLDIDQVLRETLRIISEMLGATQGSVLLLDGESRIWRKIFFRPHLSADEADHALQEVLRDGLVGHALRSGQIQIVADTQSDPRWKRLPTDHDEIGSAMALPLSDHLNQVPAGALILIHSQRNYFNQTIEPLAAALADQISVALTNASVYTRLREAEESRDSFIQMLTHDLRTPLAGMIGCFDALNTTALDADGKFFVELGFRAGAAQQRLIDDLLDVYKAEAGQLALDRGITSLARIGELMLEQVGPGAVDLGLDFQVDLPSLPPVDLDEHKMTRVLANLVSNSIKWTARGGSIAVRGGPDAAGQSLVIQVSDTGQGISPEDLPHVFDRFYQGRSRAATRGTGLGLTFCALVIAAHGGKISVESGVAVGTTMTIALPFKE